MNPSLEVLIIATFSDEQIAKLSNVSPRLHIKAIRANHTSEVPADDWKQAEILYTSQVIPAPEQAPNLRWIQFHWAGVDHAIDAPILKKPDLVTTTVSGAAVPQMGEYILTMLLALGHRLPDMIDHQKKAEWPQDRWKRFSPQELNSSIVGIVGYGSIGREVARLLRVFGATVLASKRDVMHPEDTDYTPEGTGDPRGELVHRLYPGKALKSMFKECDFVVVTVPLTEETRDLIGDEEIAALKPSAFLIDASRGGIVNHDALITALRERKFAGAALDVFPEEPLPADSPLWKLPNVIISPHISGNTRYYNDRAISMFAENLHRYLAGLPLYNRIEPERGY
jgi:phosphoglycerate dehydrogenase-like enzyme